MQVLGVGSGSALMLKFFMQAILETQRVWRNFSRPWPHVRIPGWIFVVPASERSADSRCRKRSALAFAPHSSVDLPLAEACAVARRPQFWLCWERLGVFVFTSPASRRRASATLCVGCGSALGMTFGAIRARSRLQARRGITYAVLPRSHDGKESGGRSRGAAEEPCVSSSVENICSS